MSEQTAIGWTDHTFNAWWGCVRVSAGCENCYAETFSKRTGHNIWGPAKTTPRRFFGDKHWAEPLKWNRDAEAEGRRHRVFTASMSDVFEEHPDVGVHRDRLFALIEATPWLDWQVLTKRPENVNRMIPAHWRGNAPLNWWQGTSVEGQLVEDRMLRLICTWARTRFLSIEPLIAPLDIGSYLIYLKCEHGNQAEEPDTRIDGCRCFPDRAAIDWVIVGGESGPKHRQMDPAWLTSIVEQCQAANVPVFVKQDSGQYPGKQGRIPDAIWALKQFPGAATPAAAQPTTGAALTPFHEED